MARKCHASRSEPHQRDTLQLPPSLSTRLPSHIQYAMNFDHNLDVSRLSDSETEIVLPTPTDSLCLRCKSMFSSIQSLQSLVSEEGYEHYSRKEARQQVDAGCSFCPNILRGFWAEEEDDDMPIHLKAAYNYTPIHSNLEDMSSYPTSILKMNTLESATEPQAYEINIKIYAPSGRHTTSIWRSHVCRLSCNY